MSGLQASAPHPESLPADAERGPQDEPLAVWVVLVEPLYAGNIGAAARVCKNFGARGLILVNPREVNEEARRLAASAQDMLQAARRWRFEDVAERFYTVGFTARLADSETQNRRFPFLTLRELRPWLERTAAEVALVFGREDCGLHNEETQRLDLLCTIPTRPECPSLNLAQSVAIALYELHELIGGQRALAPIKRARPQFLHMLYDIYGELIDLIPHPPTRKPRTRLILQRIFARADPTEKEVLSVYGVLRRVVETLRTMKAER